MPITDMQPAEKVWGNFGCIRIDCRTLCIMQTIIDFQKTISFMEIQKESML